MKINILLIGSGGREHALALALSKSESCGNLYAVPGNPGIFELAEKTNINLSNYQTIIEFCKSFNIQLVVIGPEQPLADGLTDILTAMGIPVFGPSKYCAQLESSKDFSKIIMSQNNIPTASFRTFSQSEFIEAHNYIDSQLLPLVLKADGLAAGKGVIIAETINDAHNSIDSMFQGEFGTAGSKVVIEEFMQGQEASVFVISDGSDYLILPVSQDHKRIGNGDIGKNTGGMGAFAPAKIVTEQILNQVENEIVKPILSALNESGNPYRGCLYIGLMINNGHAKVVEFNVRFGDPETQVVLPLVEGDLAKLFYSAAIGKIDKSAVNLRNDKSAVCVVMAAIGYPDNYPKGMEINFPEKLEDNEIIYHAGTTANDNKIFSSGGRVLGVTVVGNSLEKAIESVYKLVDKVSFKNSYFRNDIGKKGLST